MDIPSVLRVPTQIAPAQPDNPGKPRRKPKLHKKTKTKKPKRKKRQSIGIGHNGGPPLREWLATDDDAVFTFREWCAINSLSERQGRRILTAPGGPVVTQLTERRIGITRRNNRLWLESRARTRGKVRHHKAPTPAAAEASRGRTGDDRLDEQIAREAIPQHQTLQAVTSGRTCIGHLLSRGKAGVEAFDAAGHSLGLFPTTKTAADAICAKAVPP